MPKIPTRLKVNRHFGKKDLGTRQHFGPAERLLVFKSKRKPSSKARRKRPSRKNKFRQEYEKLLQEGHKGISAEVIKFARGRLKEFERRIEKRVSLNDAEQREYLRLKQAIVKFN